MRRYLLRRLLEVIPTTAGVLLLTFTLFHVMAGSPAEATLGQRATAASLAAFDARYGYNKPLLLGRWADSRAWNSATPLPSDGNLKPAFPLPPGRWRLRLTEGAPERGGSDAAHFARNNAPKVDRQVPMAAPRLEVILEADDSLAAAPDPRTRSLIAERRANGFVWEIPAGWSAVALRLDAPRAAARARLSSGTEHLLDSQFFHYLGDLARGDLGHSTAYGMRVAAVLRQGVGPSLMLTIPILLGGALAALMLATLSALGRGAAPDRLVLLGSTILMSVNYVVWVLAGQYFLAYRSKLFPIWGFEHLGYLVLPVLIGIISGLGRDIRFYRSVILDELHNPYMRTALAKGLSRGAIIRRHLLPNCLIPVITYLSLAVPFLFTGSLLLESFFGIPGLGGVSINAINSGDMATVRAIVILGALLYQFVNLLADLAAAWLDPRVRLG